MARLVEEGGGERKTCVLSPALPPPLPCSPEQAGSWLGITLSKPQVHATLARQAPFLWFGLSIGLPDLA